MNSMANTNLIKTAERLDGGSADPGLEVGTAAPQQELLNTFDTLPEEDEEMVHQRQYPRS